MYVPKFTELVGDIAVFFEDYLGKAPLLRRAALREDPARILSISDLDQILHHEGLRAQYLRLAKDGALIPEDSYTQPLAVQGRLMTDSIVADQVYAHFRAGASVLWHAMNHFRPNLRAFSAMLADTLAARSDCAAFLTPAGHQGFTIHHDPMDTFILQLHGTKHWQVWPTAHSAGGARSADGDAGVVGSYRRQDLPEPLWNTVLQAGDVMYLPSGTPHVAAAHAGTSLHLTVTLVPPTWAQLTQQLLARLVQHDPLFQEYAYLGQANLPRQHAALRQRVDHLIERLTALDTGRELHQLALQGRAPAGIAQGNLFHDTATLDDLGAAISADTPVSKAAGDLPMSELADGRVRIETSGRAVAVAASVAHALRQLGSSRRCPAAAFLPEAGADRSLAVVKTLIRNRILISHPATATSFGSPGEQNPA